MMIIEAGEFWIGNIPFTNGVNAKKRPVLVLWRDDEDVVVAVDIGILDIIETACYLKCLGIHNSTRIDYRNYY
ncbi:MAG: hypothetical protein AAGF26_18530 [Cyanobacteria bacterium P01_G01_bin.49]